MNFIVIKTAESSGAWKGNINGHVFMSSFSGRLATDNRKFRENSSFPNSLKVKRVGTFQ